MKNTPINLAIVALCILLCSATYLMAQTAQPQNSQQNNAPIHSGTDPNPNNPGQNQSISPSNPGNNTSPGTKPVDGNYGNSNTNGTNNQQTNPGHTNSGATGSTGVSGPKYNNNGSGPVHSPQ